MITQSGEALPPKDVATNIYDYPKEYFRVQVQFARKWSEISGTTFADELYQRTAIQRRLFGNKYKNDKSPDWDPLVVEIHPLSDPESVTKLFWDRYIGHPRSLYSPSENQDGDGRHFGSFAYDFNEKRELIKVHFINHTRGSKSDLAAEFLSLRISEITAMFTHIRQQHPAAKEVMGGSWLYSLEAYRRCWPPEFVNNAQPIPQQDISLRGDSVWGQFTKSNGFANQARVDQFLAGVQQASTPSDLYQAFPCQPLRPTAPIEVFYKHYGFQSR